MPVKPKDWINGKTRECINCGAVLRPTEAGHFVPPCLGEPGFYYCKKKEEKNDD